MKETIFISGPITKVLRTNYKQRFKQAEELLTKKGFIVVNPSFQNVGFTYEDYIIMGINMLARCNAIYMLKGWETSEGARLEYRYAKITGKTIYFEIAEELKE